MSQHSEWRDLQTALRTADTIAYDQEIPAGEHAEALVGALREALTAALALRDGLGETGCRVHPQGAVDPLYGDKEDPLPSGWGRCLLCNDRRRRATTTRRLSR